MTYKTKIHVLNITKEKFIHITLIGTQVLLKIISKYVIK